MTCSSQVKLNSTFCFSEILKQQLHTNNEKQSSFGMQNKGISKLGKHNKSAMFVIVTSLISMDFSWLQCIGKKVEFVFILLLLGLMIRVG